MTLNVVMVTYLLSFMLHSIVYDFLSRYVF